MCVCTCAHVYVLQDRDQLQVLFLRMASTLGTRPPLFIWSLSIRLVLRIHLPLPSQHWDYKHMLPGLASYEIDSEGSEVALGSFVITQQAISWLARLAALESVFFLFVSIPRKGQRQRAEAPFSLLWARIMVQAALAFPFGASTEPRFFLKLTSSGRRASAPREGVHLWSRQVVIETKMQMKGKR